MSASICAGVLASDTAPPPSSRADAYKGPDTFRICPVRNRPPDHVPIREGQSVSSHPRAPHSTPVSRRPDAPDAVPARRQGLMSGAYHRPIRSTHRKETETHHE
ncbi:hypothetical protein GCM10010341_12130 [Streptomyces noursei]|nr:hypothetical protein GCM10010341_12130 [Streptomyces noursei]